MLPRDCGRDQDGDYSDCTNNGRDAVVGHGGGDRARSEYSAKPDIRVRNGSQLVVFYT